MSDENIDHASTARGHNSEAMTRRGFWASWRWQRSAQVHATLALVGAQERVAEQLRIGNLIRLASVLSPGEQFDERMNHLAAEASHALVRWEMGGGSQIAGPDEWPEIRADIKKGLGL